MESPVVLDKPPEYHGNNNERGFPFDEEEGSGAWSELAARHPDIAARLRPRAPAAPAHTWARKRRPDAHTSTDDFDDEDFAGLNRFHFDDIPPEFREHLPTHWNRRFGTRDEPPPPPPPTAQQPPQQQQQQQPPPQQPPPQQQTTATQTELNPEPEATQIPQYGLRNTVDFGQKSPADPSLVNAEERGQRSVSAPPDASQQPTMSHNKPSEPEPAATNVRHIPIFVEGRDEPVINKAEFAPPPPPHNERNQYYDDGPSFHPPPNFSRSFGTPFNKGYRQGPQPFVQQKVYPQAAFGRAASPQRSHSPHDEFVKVPVHHEHRPDTPTRHQPQQHQPQQHQPQPQQHHQPQQHQQQHQPQQHQPPQQPQHQHQPQHQQPPPPQQERATSPPQPKPQPSANDPITLILSIQTDVLNLMTDVENFTGTKKDKRYLYLDEMLTRNLIKLDNIETDGKENIRLARKEAIRCIQKCIAVLEAKAEKGSAEAQAQAQAQAQDINMQDKESKEIENNAQNDEHTENAKDAEPEQQQTAVEQTVVEPAAPADSPVPQPPDTRPAEPHTDTSSSEPTTTDNKSENPEKSAENQPPNAADTKSSPKKVAKTTKKKVKDSKVKNSNVGDNEGKSETMQVDNKGDCKPDSQAMDIDGAASQ